MNSQYKEIVRLVRNDNWPGVMAGIEQGIFRVNESLGGSVRNLRKNVLYLAILTADEDVSLKIIELGGRAEFIHLYIAAVKKHVRVVDGLIDAGVSLNFDEYQRICRGLSVRGNSKMLRKIMDAYPEFYSKEMLDEILKELLFNGGDSDVVSVLIENGAVFDAGKLFGEGVSDKRMDRLIRIMIDQYKP